MAEITNIACRRLHPHPDNPRKELGDLTELAASIKENGIFQNLTVIPGHYLNSREYIAKCVDEGGDAAAAAAAWTPKAVWSSEDYTIIIGRRRAAAAQQAGLFEVPCVVVEMDEREQLQTMMIENILIATGSKNGSISVNGADVAIKGLAALAFKAKVSQSDLDEALAAILEGKADKATTLDGYGITNAYTKDEINAKISAVYKPAGAVAFAELPSLSESILGNVYNVTDAFTTTANFVEGAGNKYPKGTNVVVVKVGDAYKYDVLAGFVDLSGYVEKEAGKGLSDENFTAALKDKLDGIAAGANKYVHPTHTAAASGLYKTTVDEEGHVTATTPVTKDDITNLGIPAKDTTYGKATAAADGLMAAADKSKLDGMSIATDSEVSEMLAEVYGE